MGGRWLLDSVICRRLVEAEYQEVVGQVREGPSAFR
jgi:hypothetical protein